MQHVLHALKEHDSQMISSQGLVIDSQHTLHSIVLDIIVFLIFNFNYLINNDNLQKKN